MKYLKSKYGLFCVLLCLLTHYRVTAQIPEPDDSLFTAATILVYDDPERAIEIGNEIINSNKENPENQIKALLIISNAYASMRDYDKSLEFALKAKDFSSELNDQKLQLKVISRIASQYHNLGINDKALQILDEADRIAENFTPADSVGLSVGANYAIRGFIYRDQLNCDISITYFDLAQESFSEVFQNEGALANKSVVAYNTGNCYITLGELKSAKESFNISYAYADEVNANSLKAFSLKGLAEVLTLEKNYSEALSVLNRADSIASSVGDLVLNRGIYKGLSDNYLALGDWDKYQDYDKRYKETGLQVKMSERNAVNKLLTDHRKDVKEKEDDILKFYGIGLLVSGVAFLLILFFIIKDELKFSKEIKILRENLKV